MNIELFNVGAGNAIGISSHKLYADLSLKITIDDSPDSDGVGHHTPKSATCLLAFYGEICDGLADIKFVTFFNENVLRLDGFSVDVGVHECCDEVFTREFVKLDR